MSLRIDDRVNDEVLALLAEEAGQTPPATAATHPTAQPIPSRPAPLPPRLNDVVIGEADVGGAVGVDLQKLLEGRLLVQGMSGAGKSWTLRRLVEQTAERVQQVIIDVEGEFAGVPAAFGHLRIEAHRFDASAMIRLARRLREHRLSVVVDLSDLPREAQMAMATGLIFGLVEVAPEHWHTTLVVIDEAHLLAPHGGHSDVPPSVRNASIGAIADLMSRGRKRGLAGVLATQQIRRLAKSVVSEAQNFLIGLSTLDLDIRRAAETIGWDFRRASDRLPLLKSGDFVAVGAAFSRAPCVLRVGPVRTYHRGASPRLTGPARLDAETAARLLDVDALEEASAVDAEIRGASSPGFRAVRGFIRDPGFAAAGRVWGALLPLAPEGARVAELSAFLDIPEQQLAGGLALLDAQGVLEFTGEGADRAVRVERNLAKDLAR